MKVNRDCEARRSACPARRSGCVRPVQADVGLSIRARLFCEFNVPPKKSRWSSPAICAPRMPLRSRSTESRSPYCGKLLRRTAGRGAHSALQVANPRHRFCRRRDRSSSAPARRFARENGPRLPLYRNRDPSTLLVENIHLLVQVFGGGLQIAFADFSSVTCAAKIVHLLIQLLVLLLEAESTAAGSDPASSFACSASGLRSPPACP